MSETLKIKVGSRSSKLALVQVDEIDALLKKRGVSVAFDRKTYTPLGDRDKTTSLLANAADDFFTDALDEAILNGEINVAIHSAKDLPQVMREGLAIFALTKSLDETDAFVGKCAFEALPPGAKVATSSPLRLEQVRALRPDVVTVDIRGTIQERVAQMEKGYCDGVIVATVALKRLGLEHLIKSIMPWEATPLQGQLAVVGRTGDTQLKEIFSVIDVRRTYGRVTLVGAGPGDPDLITVKGVRALESADYVFYDYLTPQEILEYAPRAQKVNVGKRKGEQTMPQADLNRLLYEKAREGKNIVRLKGGDPLVFGRGADEIDYLRRYHVPVEVIAGVSSATGIPAQLGIPLTARGISSSVAFVSGYGSGEKEGQTRPLQIPKADTVVFLMGLTKLSEIVAALLAAGWKKETPVAVVSKGTSPQERRVCAPLGAIEAKVKEARLEAPVLIVAGETVRFYREPQFCAKQSSQGQVLYTGTNPEKATRLGEVIHFPMIEITAARIGPQRLRQLKEDLPGYDLILLTSRFAVKYFFKLLEHTGYSCANLENKKFAVIGKDTQAALEEKGIRAEVVAEVETSRGLFKALTEHWDVNGKRILFPRSALPNPYLKVELMKRGAFVDELPVYENTKPPRRELPGNGVRQVVFTSPSTVRNFLADYKQIPAHWRIFCKGPVTQQSLREAGYTSEVFPDEL